jgi:hypothetical protein
MLAGMRIRSRSRSFADLNLRTFDCRFAQLHYGGGFVSAVLLTFGKRGMQ